MSEPAAAVAGEVEGPSEQLRWDRRYRARERTEPAGSTSPTPAPPEAMARLASLLPAAGPAIDLAGGDGGGGLFLAERGLTTTVVDISPVALARAASFAAAAGLDLRTAVVDLAGLGLSAVLSALESPKPSVVTCCNYLDRRLLASVAGELPAGARFVVAIATTGNLERHRRPSARFLLEPGELPALVVDTDPSRLRVLHRREGWAADRHLAELVVEAR